VRLLAFLGSLDTRPTASYICVTQIYVPQECKLDELRGPPTHIRRHNDGIRFASSNLTAA
jgi:hypothetical protein